ALRAGSRRQGASGFRYRAKPRTTATPQAGLGPDDPLLADIGDNTLFGGGAVWPVRRGSAGIAARNQHGSTDRHPAPAVRRPALRRAAGPAAWAAPGRRRVGPAGWPL